MISPISAPPHPPAGPGADSAGPGRAMWSCIRTGATWPATACAMCSRGWGCGSDSGLWGDSGAMAREPSVLTGVVPTRSAGLFAQDRL